ncbi:RNA polymerase sigma factor [Luteococcus sp. H138]|uniref:RNA polymerase sigma factor n=1 Tax=unclassified Luteococcus TaxID=2639923 RepID=UPI00313E152C
MRATTNQRQRFTVVYDAVYADLLRFVQRRTPDGAEDVVAEALTTAWRRIDDLPLDLDDARAWIFGIAQHCLLNDRRGQRRQGALAVRIATVDTGLTRSVDDAASLAIPRADLARAWHRLGPDQQEVIALTALDGLTSQHAGQVLGITPAAYRHRLQRARAELRRLLDANDVAPITALEEVR